MKTLNHVIHSSLCLLVMIGCISTEAPKSTSTSTNNDSDRKIAGEHEQVSSAIVSKNFHQIHITMSNLTGISPIDTDINREYELIKTQLPTVHSADSLNGFNQIASTRLAGTYCQKYINANYSSEYSSLDNTQKVTKLIDEFIDIDIVNNSYHKSFYDTALGLMNNEDNLIDNGNVKKLTVLTCTAILSSSYVTMM